MLRMDSREHIVRRRNRERLDDRLSDAYGRSSSSGARYSESTAEDILRDRLLELVLRNSSRNSLNDSTLMMHLRWSVLPDFPVRNEVCIAGWGAELVPWYCSRSLDFLIENQLIFAATIFIA